MNLAKIADRLYLFRVLVSGLMMFVVWQVLGTMVVHPRHCRDDWHPAIYGIISGERICRDHGGLATNWSGFFAFAASAALGNAIWGILLSVGVWREHSRGAALRQGVPREAVGLVVIFSIETVVAGYTGFRAFAT